ncbi:non-hydrolyzing UDP-N-acetylglucosamine 2-epimerase [Polynucleobacter sp. AP-Kaivos-20-H2]|uniref:non-hydrolyzing UDP-N-acetylglucosamine 2-epimerase n=1 Tax=Polynucleobacter sp. AP-Kaivos-20-H2 TaxID=2689104 RepID=UPI001C0C151F|nr:UDP-N-acetylglucosamine 2-epimerase (non-hydrolyzing) [Polynucleobacter sp. AP-Kaivos-20-H2]
MSNKRQKILIVFGTRPEAIKMAPLIHDLKKLPNEFEVIVCVTAQHREMLDQALSFFGITPDIDLNLMKSGQTISGLVASVLASVAQVIEGKQPDMLLVHGDTSTTLATAMAGFFAGIPIGHVEAGLRTHRMMEPFPEEFNRQVVSKIARWNFAPTEGNRSNLLSESFEDASITVTGNTVIDALFLALDQIDRDPAQVNSITESLSRQLPFDWRSERFALITGHRRENFGDGIKQICKAISALAKDYPSVHFVYPVHLNPQILWPVQDLLKGYANIHLIDPLGYPEFVYLMKHCFVVLTDSGGIQEEAPSLGKPVLVMRDVSERPEAISFGTVKLVGTKSEAIIHGVKELLDSESAYQKMAQQTNPYGDGQACKRIIEVLRGVHAK